MDGGKQSQENSSLLGQVYHLTWCTKIYQKTINHTLAPSTTSKRPQINTGKGYPIRSRSRARTRPVPNTHAVRRHQSCLPQDSRYNRKFYTNQTGRLPVTSSKGIKYILVAYHYDSNTIHCRTSENKIRPGFNGSLPNTPHIIDQQRLETTPTYPVQWMSQCSQKFHEGGKRNISVSPAPHPSQKLIRTGHPNFKGAFHSWTI